MTNLQPLMPEWSGDETAILKAMWEAGHTSRTIGERVGRTRNAVIGKIHRLGLAKRKNPLIGRKPQKRAKRVRTKPPRPIGAPRINPRPRREVPMVADAPEPLNVTTRALQAGMCRYPVGDATGAAQVYCGHPRWEGSSYCAHHHRLCWHPIASRAQRDAERRARMAGTTKVAA